MEARSDVLGAGDGTFRPARSARLLNPRTPARPDLKSGAVVLAWLPPRAAHPACGIMPFRCGPPARDASAISDVRCFPRMEELPLRSTLVRKSEALLRAEKVGSLWDASMGGSPWLREGVAASDGPR